MTRWPKYNEIQQKEKISGGEELVGKRFHMMQRKSLRLLYTSLSVGTAALSRDT